VELTFIPQRAEMKPTQGFAHTAAICAIHRISGVLRYGSNLVPGAELAIFALGIGGTLIA